MHRIFQIELFETASFDAERVVLITLVHEPAAASGAEIAVQLAAREGLATVNANGTFMWGIDGKGWEDGCDTEGGRRLVSTFAAVTYIDSQGFRDGCDKGYVPTLAAAFHGYDEI